MTTTTDTIRLSDRVELLPPGAPGNGNKKYHALMVDGNLTTYYLQHYADALIAACNPPRYDLPVGVIHGSDGKFYAPGDVVRTLPDEMWTAHHPNGAQMAVTNPVISLGMLYAVRPTAANPIKPLPAHTFRLPDGELACYRRDAAKLREAGAVLWYTGGPLATPHTDEVPAQVLLVEFPAPPKTERVRLDQLHDRRLLGCDWYVGAIGLRFNSETGYREWVADDADDGCYQVLSLDVDGTVEVLATDGAL